MHNHILTFLSGNRLVIDYGDGVRVFYDARHQIIKIPLGDGGFKELVMERAPDGSFHRQLLATHNSNGQISIQNYEDPAR